MFLKGFICGWLGMAVIVAVLIWCMTPRPSAAANFSPDAEYGIFYRSC